VRIPFIGRCIRLKGDESISVSAEYDIDRKAVTFGFKGRGDWERPGFWKRFVKRIMDIGGES